MGYSKEPELFRFRGRMLTAKEIAAELGGGTCLVYDRLRRGTPLDQPLGARHSSRRYKIRTSMTESGEYDLALTNGENGKYWEDDLEARVWHLYCGGDAFGECTLEEIAELWDLSREAIRQVEHRAFQKIRNKAARGNQDALDMLAWLEARRQQREEAGPSHWERAEIVSPGDFDVPRGPKRKKDV